MLLQWYNGKFPLLFLSPYANTHSLSLMWFESTKNTSNYEVYRNLKKTRFICSLVAVSRIRTNFFQLSPQPTRQCISSFVYVKLFAVVVVASYLCITNRNKYKKESWYEIVNTYRSVSVTFHDRSIIKCR